MSKVTARIDLSKVRTAEELHNLLASRLAFPAWYGNTWEAFKECTADANLSTIPPQVHVHGYDILLSRLPQDARTLRSCLNELARKRKEIRVEWLA